MVVLKYGTYQVVLEAFKLKKRSILNQLSNLLNLKRGLFLLVYMQNARVFCNNKTFFLLIIFLARNFYQVLTDDKLAIYSFFFNLLQKS